VRLPHGIYISPVRVCSKKCNGGSPRIYAGEERFSAPERVSILFVRFSAGKPGAKARLIKLQLFPQR